MASEAILLTRLAGRTIRLNNPQAVRGYLCRYFAKSDHEVFMMLALDSQHRLIDVVEVSHGTLDSAAVYPREVLKAALRLSSAAVIFAHQHPSGVAEPSSADRVLTERLQQALRLVDIRVIDHFVIGGATSVSFAERGWV